MVSVLTGLDNFVIEEVLIEAVYCLFGSVIPAGVDPSSAITVLPGSIDLGYDRLAKVIGVANMNPVACNLLVYAVQVYHSNA